MCTWSGIGSAERRGVTSRSWVVAEALALLGEVPVKLVEADLVSCGPVISKLLRPEQGKYKSNQTLSAAAQLLALGRP